MNKLKRVLIAIILCFSFSTQAGSGGEIFGRVAAELIFHLLFEIPLSQSLNKKFDYQSEPSLSTRHPRSKPRPRLLTDEGKKVNFLYSVKFVLDKDSVKSCKKQKTVHHRSYFPWIVDYPESQYMYLWYNNQTLKEKAKKHLANVVLIKGQEENPIRVKQEAELYICPKLKPINMNQCKWIQTEKIKIDDRSHLANKQATIKMMNRAAELKGNNIAFINRTGKSPMGMQKFQYEIYRCEL